MVERAYKRFAGHSVQNPGYHNENWDRFFNGNELRDVAYASLADAISAIGSDEKTLIITTKHRITKNTTIPENVSIVVANGGGFDIKTGVQLTDDGHFEAGLFRAFWGSGTVILNQTDRFIPYWWGAKGDGVTDDTAALQRAFTAVSANGGEIWIPYTSTYYLISGDIGIRDGTAPVYVVGNGAKIKRAATSSAYNMFRFRSNMVIENLELEGYIASGTGDADVVPQNGYGFRSGPGVENCLLVNCSAHDCSFDGFYAEDENDGGHIRLINCSGRNNYRNDFACTRMGYAEIDGGTWGNDSSVILKNASIDFENDLATPSRKIRRAVVRNAKVYHKLGFSGIMGTNHEGEVDNVTLDGTVYGSTAGLFWDNYKVMRLGYYEHINGAQPLWMGALPWADRQVVGRFVLANRGQAQANSLMSTNTHLQSEWTTYFNTGGATLIEGVAIGDRKGIRLHNGSGGAHNYLEMILGVTVGEIYSFGCLIRKDEGDDFDQGVWVKCIGSGMHPFYIGPTAKDQTERICAAIRIPTGTTSVEVYVGSNSDDPYDITFADFYFCQGMVDNESVLFPNFYAAPIWREVHTYRKGLLVRGPTSEASPLRVDPDVTGAGGNTQLSLADIGTTGQQSINTQNGAIAYSVIASIIIGEPVITKNGSDTIAVAATLAILNAPTEGTANYALYIASGGLNLASGNIDVTGDIAASANLKFGSNLVMLGNNTFLRDNDNGYMVLSGGNASNSGANLILLGGSHATAAGDWTLRSGSTDRLAWDESALLLSLLGGDFSFGTSGKGVVYQAGPKDLAGSGSPESAVAAPVGSTYRDATNGALYVKASGTGNTGWRLAAQRLTATAALDFGSIAAQTTAELTITVTGAVAGDDVIVVPNGSPESGLVWSGFVSAADTVTVRLGNVTTGAIDPASRTWRATVLK